MRTISRTSLFKKDYRRVSRGTYRLTIDLDLLAVLALLSIDQLFPAKYRDHLLAGEYSNHRECHLKPDPLLIYKNRMEIT